MQKFNFKSYLYIIFFILKGFRLFKHKNNFFLVDKKRTVFITKIINNEKINLSFNNKSIVVKNPNKKGLFYLKNYSPYLCVLIT